MTERIPAKSDKKESTKDRDERVQIPLDPEEALRGLLAVEPESRGEVEDAPASERRGDQ